jgi:uncharacterized protein (TIGR02271 family)
VADADERGTIIAGMDVVGADGGKIGQVNGIPGDYIVVSKGLFFPTDYYIPRNAVATVTDKVHLNVARHDALNQGWDAQPADLPTADSGDGDELSTSDVTTPLTVPLHEEELHASTREIERGRAQVETVVTEHEHELDLPVNEEHVLVRRETVDREVEPGETVFTERTIEVPLRGEEVVIDKRVQVVEELEIDTEVVERTEHVTAPARREDVRVYDENGNLVDRTDVQSDDPGQ